MKFLNINKRSVCGLALAIAVACTGCKKDFLDVNDDPNRVTDQNITPELLFPQAAEDVGARIGSTNLTFLNNWMGYFAADGDFAIQQDETTYNIDFSFGDVLWQNYYNTLFDLYLTKQKALAGKDSVLAGASMVLSARLFQDLVDMYGNVPYSQAFQSNIYRLPAYDKGQDVYNSLQVSLDSAIIYLSTTAKSTFETVDIVAHGDQDLWIRFANTLKLRLLIHQSQVSGFNPTAELAKIANYDLLQAGDDIAENPGYANETNKQSPFYGNYAYTPTDADANTSSRANAYIVNLLATTGDPRLDYFFDVPAAGGGVNGAVYGADPGNNPSGAESSKPGIGLAADAKQDQWIFPAFEGLFIEAEAQARGWISGNAQATYEEAVTESFRWLGVDDADNAAADYLTNTSIANWTNSGASALDKAKFIAYQKYIALTGVDPVESWSDLRRLNMIPDKGYISVNPAKLSNNIPVRLLYAQSEYTTNGDNVRAMGTVNQFTSKIFWQP